MKLIVKLLFAVLVIGALLPFTLLKGSDGNPLLNFSSVDFSMDGVIKKVSLKHLWTEDNSPGEVFTGGTNLVYKWTDSDGSLQFSTSPPPPGIEFIARVYDPDINLIQAPTAVNEAAAADNQTDGAKDVTLEEITSQAYSPEKIRKLFEDAQGIETLLNDRYLQQQATTGQ